MTRSGRPEAIVTDGRASYRVAMKDIGNEGQRQVARDLNHRAETSPLPFRRRERAMVRFRRPRRLQPFASAHASVDIHVNLQRHLSSRSIFKANRDQALQEWRALIAA